MERTESEAREEAVLSSRSILLLFLFSLCLRLALLALTYPDNVGWYEDSFHHWQISYFTLHIGLPQGRLWDLGGMEYYWGILPALFQSLLMWLFRTSSIVPIRIANSLFGSASIVMIQRVTSRYFGSKIGYAAALLSAINPVLIVTDVSGMEEPLGILLLFLSLWFYDASPFKTGVFLALASMCRAEYWFLSIGVFGTYLIFRKSGIAFLPSILSWALVMSPYLWHLQVQTGNMFYPIYWNVVGVEMGSWIGAFSVTSRVLLIKYAFAIAFLAVIAALAILVRRKPRAYPVLAFFLGSSVIPFFSLGFGAYIAVAHNDRFLVDRLFALQYIFGAILVSYTAFSIQRIGFFRLGNAMFRKHRATLVLGVSAILILSLWSPVMYYHVKAGGGTSGYEDLANFVAANRQGGTVLVPGEKGGAVGLVYRIVQKGVPAEHLLSDKYHPETLGETLRWLQRHNVTLLIIRPSDEFYQPLVKTYPSKFVLTLDVSSLQVYGTNFLG